MRHRPPRSVLAAVCLALAPALAPPLAAADEPASGLHRWQVLIMGNPAGEMTAARQDDAWRVHFEFHDRGRGPALDATIRLAADGTPVAIAIDGVEYLKGAVAERFTRREGEASWESRSDAGEASVEGPAFYLSLDGTPFEGGLLAAALRLAPGHRLALLPGGEATLREVGRLEVTGPAGRRRLVHYEISGLGFTPQALWLDEGDAFFAAVSEWMSVVPEGYEDAVPGLLAAQEAEEAARYRRLATELGRRPQRGIAFTGAALFDADAGVVRPGMTVLVEGDRITAVGRDAAVAIPAGAEVVDASGSTLVPGLWDMHAHLSDRDGLLNVAAGVTTARDLANDTESLLERKRQWDAGEAIGPRVVLAGFMDGPGPFAGPTRVLVSTPDEARAAIDRYADSGHEQIKIYSSIDPQLVPAIAEHAHARGLRLSGHVPAFMTAEQAVRQGFDEIQHLNMLVLNFLPDVEDTRTPARFTAVAERAAGLDLASEPVRAFVRLLRERDVVVDPTVAIFEEMFTARAGEVSPGFAAVAHRLPAHVQRALRAGGLPVPEGMDDPYRASFARMLELVRLLHEAGIPLVAGTDALAGFALHRELELYGQAGIPAAEVLRLATLGPARLTGRDAELGSIAPGKLADFAVVPGDPTADLAALRGVTTTVKDGVVYDTAALYRALGVQPP